VAQFVLVCDRAARQAGARAAALEECARALWPPGVVPAPTKLAEDGSLALALVNPNEGVTLRGTSLCLGRILDTPGAWWRPGLSPPDGTYSLIRCSPDEVEIVADLAASRGVWYYHDPDVFLASSSQRALVTLLGSFELEPAAVTWMVTSGSLGPLPSYDRRLRRVSPDGTVKLDRHTWELDVRSRWEPYQPQDLSDEEHVRRLNDAVVETCAYLVPDVERWPVLLSGGYDSRTILVGLLQAGARPRCVTWGFEASLRDERSDAAVASRLAGEVGARHDFFRLDGRPGRTAEALERFVTVSEGQLPDFTMYADALETWETLAAEGCVGVVRGDNHGWGYLGEFSSDLNVRHHCGADLLDDYAPSHPIRRLGLPRQSWSAELTRRDGEDLLGYRDRLQHSLFIPSRISPLNHLKAPYLEIVNPLQARRVADVVASLPERLRVHPGALARALDVHGPAVPFASLPAATLHQILAAAATREVIAEGLRTATARRLFDAPALEAVARELVSPPRRPGRARAARTLRAMVPRRVLNVAMPMVGARLDSREMALRMFVAARAVELFETRDPARSRLAPLPLPAIPSPGNSRARQYPHMQSNRA
jgi:hypothetical protein